MTPALLRHAGVSPRRVDAAVGPIQRITTCPLGLAAHGKRLCPLHRWLDNDLAAMEKAFSQSTLVQILVEPTRSVPLCNFPAVSERTSR